jgi:hypothetical protein
MLTKEKRDLLKLVLDEQKKNQANNNGICGKTQHEGWNEGIGGPACANDCTKIVK